MVQPVRGLFHRSQSVQKRYRLRQEEEARRLGWPGCLLTWLIACFGSVRIMSGRHGKSGLLRSDLIRIRLRFRHRICSEMEIRRLETKGGAAGSQPPCSRSSRRV